MKMTEMDYRVALLALRDIAADVNYGAKGSLRIEVVYALEAHIPTEATLAWMYKNLSSQRSIRQFCVIRAAATFQSGERVALELLYNAPDRINEDVIKFDKPSSWEDSIGEFLDRLIEMVPDDANGKLIKQTLASFK